MRGTVCALGLLATVAVWSACSSDGSSTPQSGGGSAGATSCGPSNCTGCCWNGACQAGTTVSSCGSSGINCSTCKNNQVCKTDQTCGADPQSKWAVQPLSAKITPTNNGAEWDISNGLPDPKVQMSCPSGTNTTTPFSTDTLSPTWATGGCTTTAEALLTAQWDYQLWDDDDVSDDTITDPLKYQFTEADFVAGQVTMPSSGGMISMVVQLQKQ